MNNGLVIVFTGDGKGKTSAALGIAMRAAGHKMYVSVVQFIKDIADTGEALSAERLKPEIEFITMGRGFVIGKPGSASFPEHKKAAQDTLSLARQRARSGYWDVLILDEINNAVSLGLVDVADVLDLVRNRSPKLNIILTGRDAHPDIIEAADLVTEMKAVRHPFEKGIPAKQGIDF